MNELHLFAGAGGGILGGILLGHTCVCAVEIEPYCRKVLLQRQRDGILPKFPVWDDVKTFDGRPWRGKVDVVCGGFPCQDISIGNDDGEGVNGLQSGLWSEMSRIIGEIRPKIVFVENSPAITFRGLGRVVGDLAAMGYVGKHGVLGACHAGGGHVRKRMWIIAHSTKMRLQRWNNPAPEAQRKIEDASIQVMVSNPLWLDISDPRTYGSNDGLADRVERTKAIGNGQVPAVAKLAWEILSESTPSPA